MFYLLFVPPYNMYKDMTIGNFFYIPLAKKAIWVGLISDVVILFVIVFAFTILIVFQSCCQLYTTTPSIKTQVFHDINIRQKCHLFCEKRGFSLWDTQETKIISFWFSEQGTYFVRIFLLFLRFQLVHLFWNKYLILEQPYSPSFQKNQCFVQVLINNNKKLCTFFTSEFFIELIEKLYMFYTGYIIHFSKKDMSGTRVVGLVPFPVHGIYI
ncbi:hypothetical protein ACJX0J_013255, partial [Zea mays]